MSSKYLFSSIFVLLLLLPSPSAVAQETDYEKSFEAFKKQQQKEFNDFKNKADEEFATFLKEAWQKFETVKPQPVPNRPEPVKPTSFDKKSPTPAPVEIKPETPQEPETPAPVRVPVEVPTTTPDAKVDRSPILFYGTAFHVATTPLEGFTLNGTDEQAVADAWSKLCKADNEALISDCVRLKKEYNLNDWGFLMFTKQIGLQQFGAHRPDDIAFLQMFLLNQCGYKVRLAKVGNRLKLLVATTNTIYGSPYLNMNGLKYYVFEPEKNTSKNVYTYKHDFANAKNTVSLDFTALPAFAMQEFRQTASPSTNPRLRINTVVNRNLIEFYKNYPQCDVAIHYKAPTSKELKASLYPALENAIKGKSQKDAANILIDFVQHSFRYMTDGEQFGYEKPNFMDENFFYPACDCEDRAILYSNLVKDLLGVDAVLLDYPNHIASAVCFDEDIPGDYVRLDGKKYLICDPTYIGAPIGRCMDNYKNVSPQIIR